MSTTTLCPTCNTRFNISEQQLEAYNGLVRCGRCQAVFDAREHLQDDQPSPQLDLPIPTAGHDRGGGGAAETGQHAISNPSPSGSTLPVPGNFKASAAAAPISQAQKITFAKIPDAGNKSPPPQNLRWTLVAVNVMLLLILLAQGAYIFRVQLAANMPGLKPALVSYCRYFLCTVPLPRNLDLMSIESSDLVADPAQPSVISLDAILRNQARYAQAFPNLELTLTDTLNRPLARRAFSPADYLSPGNDEQQGLLPNRELNIKLNFDTSDLKPSGYKLFIY